MNKWCIVLLVMTVIQQALAEPATQPYAGPTTSPADFPQALMRQVVSELRQAANVSIDLERSERRSLIGLPQKASHEATFNLVEDASQTLRLRRPNRFRFTMHVPPGDSGTRMAPTIVFGDDRLSIGLDKSAPGEWTRGWTGPMIDRFADHVIQSSDTLVHVLSPELTRLLDPEADDNFFPATSDWTWLGSAWDNNTEVWRVAFGLRPDFGEPQRWEVSISTRQPHRILRIVTTGEEPTAIQELKPGVTLEPDELFPDPSNTETTDYRVNVRTEVRVTGWDLASPIPDEAFAPLRGTLTETVFRDSTVTLRVGEVVRLAELPRLKATDGQPVDLAKPAGPIVLDFWFVHCGSCIYWTPRVEELVRQYHDRGVRLYGVNDIDSPEDAVKKMQAEGWNEMISLVDSDGAWKRTFEISGYPTVIVIAPDGTIVYRDYPGSDGGMRRLRNALDAVIPE